MTTPAPAPMTADDGGIQTIIADLRLLSDCGDAHQRMTLTLAADELTALTARVATLEAELAAARKVETDDLTVARMRKTFNETVTKIGASREQLLKDTQAEVERLSAALKEAKDREHYANGVADLAIQHRNAAEAKLETARRDALEEAAARCDAIAQKVFEIRMLSADMRGFDIQPDACAAAIRALPTKDTTP